MIRILIILILTAFSASAYDRAITPVKDDGSYSVSAALIIGEYDYTGGWAKLPGVRQDMAAVESALASHGFIISKVYNPDKTALKNAVESFNTKYGDDRRARVLIYFAGHGHNMDGKGYIVLKDAKDPAKDKNGFKKGALELDYFAQKAEEMNVRHSLFVFDSCFSGSIFSAMRSIPEFMLDMLKKPVRFFIASGTENQQVPDDSVFRRRFVDGISGQADGNGDRAVTGSELGMYLQRQVSDYTKGSQTPVFGKMKSYDGEFVFFVETAPQKENAKADGGEKEKLLAVIKKAPGSPEADNALKRLREIDDSLKNMPPVEAKERKDFVMKAVSKTVVRYSDSDYPYIVVAPVRAVISGKSITAAFRLTAKDSKGYKQITQRKEMLASVIGNRMSVLTADAETPTQTMRDRIKDAAEEAVEFACPACVSEEPVLIGLRFGR